MSETTKVVRLDNGDFLIGVRLTPHEMEKFAILLKASSLHVPQALALEIKGEHLTKEKAIQISTSLCIPSDSPFNHNFNSAIYAAGREAERG